MTYKKIFLLLLTLLSIMALTACDSNPALNTKCYWCENEEECYKYVLQSIGGYKPDGSIRYAYDYKYMSEECARKAANSGKWINVVKCD